MTHALLRNLTATTPRMVRGEGIYLFDAEGRRYIDGSSGSSLVCNIGHGVKEIAAVMSSQAAELACNPFHCSHTQAYEEMAARLIGLAPPGFEKVFGVSSGSEAVENSIKFGRQFQVACGRPSKHLTISRWQSYHGNTLGALACSGYTSRRRKHTPLLRDAVHIPPAFCYRCYFEKAYPACELKCARALESAILQEGPENVAAFIAEPVVGAALGGVPAPPSYFEKVREICDRYEVLFIADEVMCGLGRTGANFAIDHWSVAPDLIATGKGMGSGYFPMGASLVSEKIVAAMQAQGAFFEGVHTCCGHLLGSRVAGTVLDYLSHHRLVENTREQGELLLQGLNRIKSRRPSVGDVRGLGLMAGVEFVRDQEARAPFPVDLKVAERVMDACMERGLIVFPGHGTVDGTAGDHLLLGPPLVITSSEIEEMLMILDDGIAAVEREIAGG
ncbi:MAG: aminotransferase class III-fold pyridoxal phosphate-dependent enzyme [Desulfobacteraceae bacterium]|nr:MAG: aminotransferase class III-fold pyridoxal phosphate-dependent enzyme [Desulfobacteraceae bacterium]